MHRRALLEALLACGVAGQIAPRQPQGELQRADGCTSDTGIVDWIPDVLHPVAAGMLEYTAAEAPMPLRIFFPSHQPLPDSGGGTRPMLKRCGHRWPLVLFLHGRPPCESMTQPPPNPTYFRRWTAIPEALAKSGYVVVVPSHDASINVTPEATAAMLRLMDWVRDRRVSFPRQLHRPHLIRGWENAEFVDPARTAVIGHSWGALLAAAVAVAQPSISSFVSLEGGFLELSEPIPLLESIPSAAKLFIWAEEGFGNLIGARVWDFVAASKHGAEYPGGHFDFLPPTPGCNNERRGACEHIEAVTADLCALFIARHTPVAATNSAIPISLRPPNVTLSTAQALFGANNLDALRRFRADAHCRMRLQWEGANGEIGARNLGRTLGGLLP